MKRIYFVLFGSFLLLFIGCCKEPVPVESCPVSPLTGNWEIVNVDSGYYANIPNSTFQLLDHMELTGEIAFSENGTGSLTGDIKYVTCGIEEFFWVYSDSIYMLYLVFNNKLSKSYVHVASNDSLIFDFSDFCKGGDLYTGATIFYSIKSVKK